MVQRAVAEGIAGGLGEVAGIISLHPERGPHLHRILAAVNRVHGIHLYPLLPPDIAGPQEATGQCLLTQGVRGIGLLRQRIIGPGQSGAKHGGIGEDGLLLFLRQGLRLPGQLTGNDRLEGRTAQGLVLRRGGLRCGGARGSGRGCTAAAESRYQQQ